MKSKSKIDLIFKICVASFLVFYALTIFILLGWGLIQSFRYIDDYTYNGALSLPTKIEGFEAEFYNALKFGNYKTIMEHFYCESKVSYFTMFDSVNAVSINHGDVGVGGLLFNTLYMAVICSFAQVFITYLVAFLCAKYKFKFSAFIYGLVIFMMTVPTVGTQPATVKLLQDLNLFGRYGGMLLMRCCFGGMYFLVFYGFFEGLPDSYVEAAEIDGASQLNILLTIIIPLGIKTILTITLILFVANWNDYSMSYIYMPSIPTLALAVYELAHIGYKHSSLTGDVYKIAGTMMLAIPITLIFVLFRDKIMGDISAGGLKG
ncbi:MAG: carbohydrate ABC transporter permease [Clostridia bacterium]|nr:carbohydrate ABC transporter permease [Clostridia bacterium]